MIDWTHWHNEPVLIGGLIFLGWLYAILTGPLREKLAPGTPYPRGHACRFYAALLIFYLAVGSPLDQLGERFLLSAHMLQHQLIIYPAAVLFLLGLPAWLVSPITGRPGLRPLLRFLTNPVVCGVVYTVVLSGWHMPLLYDLALQNRPIHILEHFTMFGAALFYWWPIISPSKEFPPLAYGWHLLYLPAVVIGMTPVFAYITFSPDVLYPTYEYAPRITSLDAAGDQLLAGSMMKLIGMGVSGLTFAVSFYRWYQQSENRR
ncbi:cytochrome c oxidase assembly protein [Oleiharenicola lentus]|jgi:putative membrane protein|uniref:Cytochrome c oxidase assembly protein n=1 Tax=Oleiharenicola lentus TaxID=2508720 RepID=A0A4Q1C9X5_9BACT|nr:cytochrome c oxidase assembly protein [Oleiharenicola lentus]RXK55778.1 cytochrome c oxidase assembly protein [Oleiharenicola lentus]